MINWQRMPFGDVWRAESGNSILWATHGHAEIMAQDGRCLWREEGSFDIQQAKAKLEEEAARL